MAKVIAVGTAVPEYTLRQEEARRFAHELFSDSFSNIDRLLTIFENTAIATRHFSRPREWFEVEHSFAERNEAYIETACRLGEEAIQRCLAQTGVLPSEIDHLYFVSTTGLATPSIDAHLINRLGMNRHVKRTPIWGLGCAGGVVGLARAGEYAKAFPKSKVLLVAIELCGLTFRRNDLSKSNLVATSLFADGAAAVLVVGEEAEIPYPIEGPHIVSTMSTLFPESLDVMGWDVTDDGLKVVFSKDIPTIVSQQIRPVVESFLAETGLEMEQLEHFIAHPGGMKVIQAYHEALGKSSHSFRRAYEVLNQYGNMSSATVLFVLERELQESHDYGSYGLVTALGPGFSAEMALLRWGSGVIPACLSAEMVLQRVEDEFTVGDLIHGPVNEEVWQ